MQTATTNPTPQVPTIPAAIPGPPTFGGIPLPPIAPPILFPGLMPPAHLPIPAPILPGPPRPPQLPIPSMNSNDPRMMQQQQQSVQSASTLNNGITTNSSIPNNTQPNSITTTAAASAVTTTTVPTINSRDPRVSRDPRLQRTQVQDCVLVSNIPLDMAEWDLEEFMQNDGPVPNSVSILPNKKQAVCEFTGQAQAEKAIKLNNRIFNGNRVTIELISRDKVNELKQLQDQMANLNGPTSGGSNGNSAPAMLHHDLPRDPRAQQMMDTDNMRFGGGGNRFAPRDPRAERMMDNRDPRNLRMDPRFDELRNGGAYMSRDPRGGGTPLYDDGSQSPMDRGMGRSPYSEGGQPNGPGEYAGRVILIENIPYKATTEDILDFFGPEFNLNPNHVMRRFNDRGQPAGEAKVLFHTPQDCKLAFNLRRTNLIGGRKVYLKPL